MAMIAMMSSLCVMLMALMATTVISEAAHQSCQEDFLIRQSVIIRTEDSRRRGASFLNVTEVAETSQCLQQCCNKVGCNAAVYDDKNRNCYLFDCGRLDDYRCLFTSHTRFISATLRDGRDVLELDQWGSQNRHAAELNKLKDTATDEHLQQVHPTASKHQEQHHQDQLHQEQFPREQLHRDIGQIPREEVLPALSLHVSAKKGGRRCGRHQFECHSGECIAIYNACDGIAQCQDASDEHAELACPPELGDETGILGAASAMVADNSAVLQNPARPRLADVDNNINFDIQGPFWDGLARNAADKGDIFAHRRNSVLGTAAHFPLAADSVTNNNRINSVQPINWPGYGSGIMPRYPVITRYDDMYPVWSGGTGTLYSEMRKPSISQQYQQYQRYQNPVARLMGSQRPQLTPGRPQLTHDGEAPQGNVMNRAEPVGEDQLLEKSKADISASRPVNRSSTAAANNSVEQKQRQMIGSDVKKVATTLPGPTKATSILDDMEFRLSDLNALAERQSSEKRTAATLLGLGIAMCLSVIILGVVRMRCCRLTREARKRLAHDSDYLINGLYL